LAEEVRDAEYFESMQGRGRQSVCNCPESHSARENEGHLGLSVTAVEGLVRQIRPPICTILTSLVMTEFN
jgi:hypothetical protein